MIITCRECGIVDGFTEKKGAQIGLYCDKCGRWIKWLSGDEARLFKHNEIRMLNENRQAGYSHGYAVGYREAIDDVVNLFKSKTTMENNLIEEIAEHLKAGGNIELSEHSES